MGAGLVVAVAGGDGQGEGAVEVFDAVGRAAESGQYVAEQPVGHGERDLVTFLFGRGEGRLPGRLLFVEVATAEVVEAEGEPYKPYTDVVGHARSMGRGGWR